MKKMRTHLGFEITVNDSMMSHENQRHQHLTREASNEGCREPNKAIGFDELIEVDA